ncbi:cyclic lactone autoinducer peptide [Clostridium sp. NSJ-6]|uniref:Cyclic lactone autoinducer peptide n=1 Tax=Clostridium hominis TaxID=2763036 RepID=A0ABR7D7J7_9CLOT|nr:cyclic lactone autoinducer peptide [Clostridium hominis]MBC5627351.1 cyclic lactone autoinducer peptide [Clostridium hominis]
MKKRILMTVATVATVFASLVATSACYFGWYQPEEPQCLRDE